MSAANPASEIIKRGAASVAALRPAAVPRVAEEARFPALVQETTNGEILLVNAETGVVVGRPATRALAEQIRTTFRP